MANGTTIRRGPLRLGFGCSGAWGEPWFSERKAHRLLHAALELGVTHIDTAGFYGEAEARLGRAIRGRPPEAVFVSTKTGSKRAGFRAIRKDFSETTVISDVETSLRRLGRDRIDLLYLHGPGPDHIERLRPVTDRLKKDGKVAAIGLCSEGRWLTDYIDDPMFTVFMAAYNVFRRDHEPAFARARAAGKAVVAIAPLAQALYRTDFFAARTPADAWRVARALAKNRAELAEARTMRSALAEPGWTPAALALAFALRNPAVDMAVTTTSRLEHLRETASAAQRPLSDDLYRRLRALVPEAADTDDA